jgi:hypothetical protein
MMNFRLCHQAIVICIVALMLSACEGNVTPSAPTQQSFSARDDTGTASWILTRAVTGDLLYVSNPNGVSVFSYPQGKSVGMLGGFKYAFGLCSDKNGDIFVVDDQAQDIVEYAHGGTKPIATLRDTGNYPNGCAVDPMTGNLAVAGGTAQQEGNIAIYTSAKGPPTVYHSPFFSIFLYCTYDDLGNVFATAEGGSNTGALTELPKGGNTIIYIPVNKSFGNAGAVQWHGKYLALGDPSGSNEGPARIYQAQVSGSTATVVNTIKLYTGHRKRNLNADGLEFWIQGHHIVYEEAAKLGGFVQNENVGLWHYPTGGIVISTIPISGPLGVTVSLAPH